MLANRLVTLDMDCVITDRPGEPFVMVEGVKAGAAGTELPALSMTRPAADELDRILASDPDASIGGLFGLDGTAIERIFSAPSKQRPALAVVSEMPTPRRGEPLRQAA